MEDWTAVGEQVTLPLVVIGGSAGALTPLLDLIGSLPATFPGLVLVVVHTVPDQPSRLPELLSRAGPLPARHAVEGLPLEPGHIYVAPPNHHLLVRSGQIQLSQGPRENNSRPSIDVLFRSAAYTCGSAVAGVLLSGMLDDGTSGLWAIKHLGGRTLVQHPEEAEYPDMPLSAIRAVEVDEILPVRGFASRLLRWAEALQEARPEVRTTMTDADQRRIEIEVGIAAEDNAFKRGLQNLGTFSPFTCPQCHGVLTQLKEGKVVRYRCHTGHAYTARSLISDLRQAAESRLWDAARVLEENVMLLEHLAKHALEADEPQEAEALHLEAVEAISRSEVIRTLALRKPL